MGSYKNLSIVRETVNADNMIEQCASSEFMGRYIVEKDSCQDEGNNWIDFVPNEAGQLNEWEGLPSEVLLPNQGSKMNQKIETRKESLCLKKETNPQQSQNSLDSVFRVVTRKRSCFSKPGRSSPWGKRSGISNDYYHSNELVSNTALSASLLKSHSPDTQPRNTQIQGNPQVLSVKDPVPKRYIRLKIKFGKSGDQPLFAKLSKNKDRVLSDTKHEGEGLEFGKLAGEAIDDNMVVSSSAAVEARTEANGSIGVYTSPDSEVINQVPVVSSSRRHLEELDSAILSPSDAVVMNGKGRKKKPKAKSRPKYSRRTLKMEISVCPSEIPSSTTSREALSNLSYEKEDTFVPLLLPEENELGQVGETQKVENFLEDELYCSWGSDPISAESLNSEIVPSTQSRGLEISQSQKFSSSIEEHSKFSGYDKNTIGKKPEYKQNLQRSPNQRGIEIGFCDQYVGRTKFHREELSFSDSAWVQCDDCDKWRRVQGGLALSIEANCRWICTDNSDKSFGDCSIPQELSNEEISLELGISNVKEDASKKAVQCPESRQETGCEKPSFRGIKCNQYLHRTRKSQNIDEIMVCECKPPSNGRLGCGDECINRILNIECVRGACPCGNLCSNQQFQRRKYAKLELFKAGKKGYGLRVLQDLREGQFIIEYVGEVLDSQAYEARLKDYAAKGQQHFYLMTLSGNEVIDADAKGNLGRFINHSCDPNCRTEKWMVNGEICIGIFALREIKKEEELTFDYNYVRLFGAAVKKCYCGSSLCHGYMGGDLLTGDVVIQSDSDDECDSEEDYYKHARAKEEEEEEEVIQDKMEKPVSRHSPFGDLEDQIVENHTKVSVSASNDSRTVGLVDDLLTEDVVLQSDSDEKFDLDEECLKPLRPKEEEVMREKMENPDSRSSPVGYIEDQVVGNLTKVSVTTSDFSATNGLVDDMSEVEESNCYSDSSVPQLDTSKCKILSLIQPLKVPLSPEAVQQNINLQIEISNLSIRHIQTSDASSVEAKKIPPALFLPMEHSGSCIFEKKEKGIRSSPDSNNVQKIMPAELRPSSKPKRITEGCSNGQTESVEMKLNELLNSEGGISKRKDATKGYLKLLFLTAASSVNVSSETIQRNRDLSMILDALLKTRSRAVLTDIINKNGLQMLHNIIKQYKGDFKKIPVLRKLLKILEYLASRDILGLEHIVRGPPCEGMESFRDSLLILTEHDDKQVHQIARNFRDKWIPRPFRRPTHTVRDDNMIKSVSLLNFSKISSHNHHSPDQTERLHEALDYVTKSKHFLEPEWSTPSRNATIAGKRKSRWDQPADSQSLPNKEQKIDPMRNRGICSVSGNRDIEENVSSGFRPNTLLDMVLARPQEKFVSRLPVSYGIPLDIVWKFGSSCTGMSEMNWAVAPGIPFEPFPPLPSYPRKKEMQCASSSYNCTMINNNHDRKEPGPDRTNGVSVMNLPCLNTRQGFKRRRVSLWEAGRMNYRRQKLFVPPRLRNRCGRW